MKLPYFSLRDRISNSGLRGGNDILNVFLIMFCVGEASVLILGGTSRWQGEQFTFARQVPGAPYTWAALLLVATVVFTIGICMPDGGDDDVLSRRGWLIVTGGSMAAVWFASYAFTFWLAIQAYPTQVSLSGPLQWGAWAALFILKVGQHLHLDWWSSSRDRT